MNVIEFFAGSRSIGKVADRMGCQVFSTDIMPFKDIDYVTDIMSFDFDKVPFLPDVVWFSPPCTAFSIAAISHHWMMSNGTPIPKSKAAIQGLAVLDRTIEVINHYLSVNPNLIFWIENPRGMMRKMHQLQKYTRHTVSYCQYGDNRMKPTDIWTNSTSFSPKMCRNGAPCHVAAPRGSKTGTQGLKNAFERSMIPEKLCESILRSCF